MDQPGPHSSCSQLFYLMLVRISARRVAYQALYRRRQRQQKPKYKNLQYLRIMQDEPLTCDCLLEEILEHLLVPSEWAPSRIDTLQSDSLSQEWSGCTRWLEPNSRSQNNFNLSCPFSLPASCSQQPFVWSDCVQRMALPCRRPISVPAIVMPCEPQLVCTVPIT